MADVEILLLGEVDTELVQREFDAISYVKFLWTGLLRFEQWSETDSRIFVFSDRKDILGEEYATRPGKIEEVTDSSLAKAVIAKAIESCFDHRITVEALPDGKGGWITLQTDT